MTCHFCGYALPRDLRVYRNSLCPSCDKDLKICLNCEFYAPGAHWDCRETILEPVRDKDRANFCDYFKPHPRTTSGGPARRPGRSNVRSDFDKLFG